MRRVEYDLHVGGETISHTGWFHGFGGTSERVYMIIEDRGYIREVPPEDVVIIDDPPQPGPSDDELRVTFGAAALTGIMANPNNQYGNNDCEEWARQLADRMLSRHRHRQRQRAAADNAEEPTDG